MPLASWLDAHWNHKRLADGYSTVVNAAKALDEEVWRKFQFKLLYLNDPVKFRDLSEKEVERASRGMTPECEPDFPQLGTHADPTCRAMDKETFFALIGCVSDRPLQVFTMNTAALYRDGWDGNRIAHLILSRLLWSDQPGRDCAGLSVELAKWTVANEEEYLPAIHLGTAWTHKDKRDKGIMGLVSRLHRLVVYIRFGALPQFGTVVPDRRHPFKGREIGTVIETRDGLSKESKVLFYSAESLVEDAQAVLAESSQNMKQSAE